MDISLIIVSTLVVLCVFGPIFFIIRSGSNDRRNLIKQFKSAAAQHQLNIKDFEAWGDKIIGIDHDAKKLLFLRENSGNYQTEVVLLSEIQKCEPVIKYRIVQSKNGKEQLLEEASLRLVLKNTSLPGAQLYFYDEHSTLMPDFEEKRVEKWHKAISAAA